jgi:hypothetical protein
MVAQAEGIVDSTWLTEIYEDAGLEREVAERAGELTFLRILRRERVVQSESRRKNFADNLVGDPMASWARICGRGDGGIPFMDDFSGCLSELTIGRLLSDADVRPVVALSVARVVVEAQDPETFYRPIWEALGQTGPVDLRTLRRLDWSPIRAQVPDSEGRPADLDANQQVPLTLTQTLVSIYSGGPDELIDPEDQ